MIYEYEVLHTVINTRTDILRGLRSSTDNH